MTLLILYILLAIGFSFLCSILEAVLLSITPAYLGLLEQQGSPAAAGLKALKEEIDRPLAAILSLNTVAHTVGAAGAGAQAAVVFGDAMVGAFSAVLTFLILVLSEIIPKTLGATYWKALAPTVARILPPLIWILYPLVKLSEWLTVLIARGKKEVAVSRAEIAAMAKLGEDHGVIREDEARIVANLLRLRQLKVRNIMTPRPVVFSLSPKQTVRQVVSHHEELRFSRIPLTEHSKDHIDRYVLKDDVLLKAAQDEHELPLEELGRPLLVVQEHLTLSKLFEKLLDGNEHIALVVDEYGGTAGVVTLEDAVETLLGLEIVDEADSDEDLQELAREQWRKRARRLGVPIPGVEDPADEQRQKEADAAVRFGITGGQPPEE